MNSFNSARRDLLRVGSLGMAGAAFPAVSLAAAKAGDDPVTRGASAPGLGVFFNVRSYGAAGDGKALDSPAINRAVEAAAAAGGGMVLFPAGIYLSFSIRLKSNVHLHLEQGATILAADSPKPGETTGYNGGTYDAAEPNDRLGALSGLRPQPLAQLAHLGRGHSRCLHHRPRPHLRQGTQLRRGSRPRTTIRTSRLRPRAARRHSRRTGSRAAKSSAHGPRRLPHVPGRAAWRRQQGHRSQELPQRPAARLLHPQGRPLRPAAHRRRQPHHRQPHHRHRSRRHGHRLLPERARLELHGELALGRRHLPQVQLRARLRAAHAQRDDCELLCHRLLPARYRSGRYVEEISRRRASLRHRPHQVRHRIQRRLHQHHHHRLRLRGLPRLRSGNRRRRAA